MPRFCETCGTPLTETARFCANCGAAVVTPTQSSVAETPPSVVTPPESSVADPHPIVVTTLESVADPHPIVVTPPESSIATPSFRNSGWVVVGAVAAILVIIVVAGTIGVGKNKGKDYVWADGTKVFGERTLNDGTTKRARVEYPNGEKLFDVTKHPDGSREVARVEFPNGERDFDVTLINGKISKIGRSEFPNGQKDFDVTVSPNGIAETGRVEFPDGKKQFNVTQFRDDTRSVGRAPNSDGTDMPSQQSSATPSQSSSTPVKKDARQSFLELRESGRLPSWAKLVCFVDHSFLDEVEGDWGPNKTIDTPSGPKLDSGKKDEFWLFSGNLMRVQAWDKGVGENFLLFHKLTAESFYSRGTWNNRSVAIALNLRINNREIAEKDGGYLAPPGGRFMSCESIN